MLAAQLRDFGRTKRGWLGVRIQTVDEDLAKTLGLDKPRGALVADVTPGGPAEKADIKSRDVILTFDGKGTLGKRDLHTTETAQLRFGGPEQAARLRLAGSDGGRLDLDAALRGEDATVRAQVAEMGLNLFNADVDGRVDATLALQGRGDQLAGTLTAKLDKARGRGEPAGTEPVYPRGREKPTCSATRTCSSSGPARGPRRSRRCGPG